MINIIIPVYNSRDTLPNTLDSLVAQTYKKFLVTISKDGDESDYTDIINEYRRRGLHIRLFDCIVNGGPGVARQKAFDNDTMSDYVMFLDSDDLLMPRAVEVLYKSASSGLYDFCISSLIIAQRDKPDMYLPADGAPVTWVLGKIYRTRFLIDNNIRFLDNLRINEDSYFNFVVANATTKKGRIDEFLGIMVDNKNSITRSEDEKTFFKKSAEQYLYSQLQGIVDLIRITKQDINPQAVAAGLLPAYEYYQKVKRFDVPITFGMDPAEQLKNNEIFQNTLSSKELWDYVVTNLKGSCMDFDVIFFFEQTFGQWLGEFFR